MPDQPDSTPAGSAVILPVIGGGRWFDAEGRPFVLRVEFPLAFEEMVAALYGAASPDDLGSAEELCGAVAAALLAGGLSALRARADAIRLAEQHGAVEAPSFLARCRERVAALLPGQPQGRRPRAAEPVSEVIRTVNE